MSLKYALLGLLAERPDSGYALTQRFEQSLQKYAWHANHSQIYPELAKLAADNLATVVEEGARGRRTYAITDAGREALREWLLTSGAGPRRVRNEAVLRTFLLSTLEPDDAAQLLRRYVDRAAQDLAELRAVVADLDAAEEAGEPQRFGRFAAEFGLRQYAAFHDWARWALARVESAAPRQQSREQGREQDLQE
ncbi:PadR family transcriptional regulator [Actinopolymorpha rutila]|uniref:DNA-binding PadR family transcriptional regulator n=1 Tax=Actinopolymorpha rutila TaxID=446787 RepID=A0A852ZLL6_9ACTN|nr:PadR family transcriptional regulator [Actinopolymorpha rutila]NYH89316.1 DNA-binding PadR family transcriptional regulator [Actinopolymorpha rutila]